ncbi:hypothetical protein VMCG_06991 [Cytospora schulzeri]|uniref:Phospholipase/carboxylesterase/thioesterase domain-containing protein n=1 Tax=Cytospora schulzeri TaxID=448051 RepID=A0A423W433_9PEZI|nr:hypothetical protein VMCG_06991 [Valsa malicola]
MLTPCYTIGPRQGAQHSHTIIFLHGRDSLNDEFAGELFESEASQPSDQPRTLLDLLPTFKWVFPAAPMLRSARFDTDMSQWFDMSSVENPDEKSEIQLEGLRNSVSAIIKVIQSEANYVPRQKIFLAGISQGFATAIAAFFADDARQRLAGIIGMSSWMPLSGMLTSGDGKTQLARLYRGSDCGSGPAARSDEDEVNPTPVLLCHSSDDDVVPVQHGRALRDILNRLPGDIQLEWHEYEDGGHWINEPLGVDDLISFIKRHM